MKKLFALSVGLFYIGLPVAQAQSKFVPIQDLNQVQEKGSLKVAGAGEFHHGHHHHHHHHHHFHGHHGHHHHHFFHSADSQITAQAVPVGEGGSYPGSQTGSGKGIVEVGE